MNERLDCLKNWICRTPQGTKMLKLLYAPKKTHFQKRGEAEKER